MEKDMTILGKFYLKNGNIIEEKIRFDEGTSMETIDNFINDATKGIKLGFKENLDFQCTFGNTIFRGSELAAVALEVKEKYE